MRLVLGPLPLRLALTVIAIASCCMSTSAAERHVFEHEFVLGTSLQIVVDADSYQSAQAAEARVLAEIKRLEKIFSGYDRDSELSQWQNTVGQPAVLSTELFQVLAASDRWRTLSQGAFNPAAQAAIQVWKNAERASRLPSPEELKAVVDAMQRPQWQLDTATGRATRLVRGPLSFDAIAKGTIIDRAAKAAKDGFADIHGVIINIGGDLRSLGETATTVQITDPFRDALNAPPLCTLHVANRGVATSGNYRRGVRINEKRLSHIIDPRTAQPADRFASVTVVADTAETADALATTFSVLSISEIRVLTSKLREIDYLLVTTDGEQIASPTWKELLQPRLFRFAEATQLAASPEASTVAAQGESQLLQLEVKFELAKGEAVQYRRPYVAIWLEDEHRFPVRTAVLWITTKDPGPRWHRDLFRWYRNDRTRKLADQRDLIGVISEATRGPGEYKAVFDGKDDAGQPLKPGKYTLYLEAAREHGTYQLIRQPLQLGSDPIAETKLKSNAEFKSASFRYGKPSKPASR